MKYIAIIPARYASTRFPGKPLAMIGGKPMIQRTYEAAAAALGAENTAVATDDTRIFEAVEAFGGRAVMTSAEHRSGTDRCREAYERLGSAAEIIINVQGDEPFLQPEQLRQLISCFDEAGTDIATLARSFDPTESYEKLEDGNTPKVVCDAKGFALYFSRSVIPYVRGAEREERPACFPYLTHVGLYAFRAEVLKAVSSLPQCELELAESLEQLRWLHAGYKIRVAVTELPNIGIDTPADLEAAERMLSQHKEARNDA
ncbi:MAG: 3-deoxy-manno-octulosonate cytidylyltransferase [Muribaculaceae bacterium]|nr:3-deoxy-manno-octulosonate cytidylyltransferase [Muribaculaceae bacterium]